MDAFLERVVDDYSTELDPGEIVLLDTEFTGLDQDKPDLISIALVDKAGREFYAELPPGHYAVQCNEWVHFNVLPSPVGRRLRGVASRCTQEEPRPPSKSDER